MNQLALRGVALLLIAGTLAGCDRFTSVDTRLSRAATALQTGEYQSALIDARKAVDAEPGNAAAQLMLFDVLLASGDTQAAAPQLDRAVAAGAGPAATEPRKIELALAMRKPDDAAAALDASTALADVERAILEGRILLSKREFAAALAAFERALAMDPRADKALLGRAEALAAQGSAQQALQALDTLTQRDATLGRAWILKGSLEAQSEDFAAAASSFAKAVESGRGLSRDERLIAHAQRVESLLAANQLQPADAALAALEKAAGTSPIVSLIRAKVAIARGDKTVAVNELRRFTQAAPQHLPGRLLLTTALVEQGSLEQAFSEAVRTVAEFPNEAEPRLALARIQMQLGRLASVEETLQPLIASSPPHPMAVAALAELRIRRGEGLAGVSLLEQTVAEQPSDARLQLQLAAAYLSTGEPKRALATLQSIQGEGPSSPQVDRLRVIATAALSGSANANKELEAAIARHPDDVDLLLMAAAYHSSIDEPQRARAYVERAIELRPSDATLSLILGRIELLADRPDEAERLAKAVLEKAPNDAAAMMLMANIAAKRGDSAEVDAWLGRARIAKPDALDVRIALARRAAARADMTEARNVLAEAVRNTPDNPSAHLALAELDAAVGNYEAALADLRAAAKLQPRSPFVMLATARVQLAAKNNKAARESLRQALEYAPGWMPAATILAALENAEGNLDGALELAREVQRSHPDSGASFLIEGDAYIAAKRPADAARAYAESYRRTPSAVAAIRLVQAKSMAKMPSPEAELADWVARTPKDASARRALAEYYLSVGKGTDAIRELERVVADRPNDAVALNNLAWLYQQSNDSRALEVAARAYAAAPGVASIADTYGWILVSTGDTKKGLEILEQAAKLAPNNGEIQYHLAAALAQSGERSHAREVLNAALSSLDSRSPSRAAAEKLRIELN